MIKSLKRLIKITINDTIKEGVLKIKREYIPIQSDLFLVEFPKSGVTWLSNIIANIEILNSTEISECKKRITFGNLESFISDRHLGYPSSYYSPIFAGKLLKSHTRINRYIHRVIYIYRHPVSVMKSYYRMCKGYKFISNEMTFSEFIRDSETGIESWKQHVKGWLFASDVDQRIFFVSYENLVEDAIVYVQKIYDVFGIDALPKHIFEEAIQRSSADNMKILETQLRENDLRFKVRYDQDYRFVKGSTGTYFDNKEEIEEAEQYIRLQCKDELRWLGYEV